MVFKRFVELGRVVYLANGKDEGKLAAIVNIVDGNRMLVDGPHAKRQIVSEKQMRLTRHIIKGVLLNQRTKRLNTKWTEAKIDDQWKASAWAKKISSKAKREAMNDFDRFKLFKAKQTRNRIVRMAMGKLKKGGKTATKKPAEKKPAAGGEKKTEKKAPAPKK